MRQHLTLKTLLATSLLVPVAAFATNGYQLIGVGAYQKGLAGAVTAAPGSAMTAVTNPAGAARVGSRADFSMEMFMPTRDSDFTALGGGKADSTVDSYGVPALGWTAPTSDGSDLYFGGGMYGTSGMGVDYAPTLMMPAAVNPTGFDMYWDGYSNISFWQMAPVLAKNINSRLSVGASLNIDYQSVSFQQRVMLDTDSNGQGDSVMDNFDLSRAASGFGLGISFGMLYDLNDAVTVGLSYRSQQEFSPLEYQLAAGDIYVDSNVSPTGVAPGSAGTYELDLDFPQQAALGVAYRANDQLTLSADLKWIDWSSTMDTLAVKGPNGSQRTMDPGWDDQTVIAVGVNYQMTPALALRAGYNHAESPIDDKAASRNMILPAVVETHYTVGLGYTLNNRWDIAFHYMHVPEVTRQAPATDPQAPGAEIALSETSFGTNIGYRF